LAALEYADILFGNETEFAALGEKQNWGTDLVEIAKKVAEFPKANQKRSRIVVITQGSKSTLVYHEGKAEEFSIVPIPAEEIVDTNGAGDAFVGGFMAGLMKELPLERCVNAGHNTAAFILRTSGTCFAGVKPSFEL